MKPTWKHATAVLAAVTLAGALSSCVESGRDATTTAADTECPFEPDTSIETTARIAWQPIPNGDLVVKDRGLLEACMPNADIEWVQAASGGDVVQYFGSGDVDLGLMGSSPATIASSQPKVRDVDLAVVWIHDVIGDAESLVVKDENITEIGQLEGKTIAVPFSSTAHYSLLQALIEAGLDPNNDVNVINLDPEAMAGAWQGDEIDAAWVWDPTQSQLLEAGGTRILSSEDTAEAGRPTFDLGAVDRTFAAENEDFMTMWAEVQDHAVQQIQEDPDAAAESVAVVLGIEPEAVKTQFEGLTYLRAEEQASEDYLGGKLAEDLHTTAEFLLDQGGISKVGTVEHYAEHVDAGPARRAAE